uniref:NADH-ubiquinone oxidoreductase chain 5 n=1 Tax=Euretidae gen. sp. DVL-2014 TaxID=1569957 RepID=A0A0N7AFS4_9METZ|nr:NADH dehydrogenase subunit 5 [Euretidae gen. sp. DVL-2014]
MYLLIILIPLINFTIAWTLSTKINTKSIKKYTTYTILLTWTLSTTILYECIINETHCQIPVWSWIKLDYLKTSISIKLDLLSSSMLLIITAVSFFVHLYSTKYMENDPHTNRFMSYLSLFTFFMIILVTSNNYLLLLIGWEGVGICSYLLINFWFTRIQANKAGVKAIVINRISDMALLTSIILLITKTGTLKFENTKSLLQHTTSTHLICILLLLSAVGKSSLIGLHIWLPDAMEGPTPVSALIHAATMVTAGIFILIRSSHILSKSKTVTLLIAWIGVITAFFAATIGSVQNDIKRIIAYSTCSQLGYMTLAIGLSYYSISLLHLINHAFFKSLLFLGAGITIHSIKNEQDIRKLGNLKKITPLSYTSIITGSLTISGLPFLTSYYSKDLILENSYKHSALLYLALITAGLTAIYSTRLLYITFIQNTNMKKGKTMNTKESESQTNITLYTLSIYSIIMGYLLYSLIISTETHTHSPQKIKIAPILLSTAGALTIIFIYNKNQDNNPLKKITYLWKNLTSNAWHFNTIYNNITAQAITTAAHTHTYKTFDQGILEDLGPKYLSKTIITTTSYISNTQSTTIYQHITTIIIFLTNFTIYTYLCLSSSKNKNKIMKKIKDAEQTSA